MSFTVHNILAAIADDEERFTTILNLPEGKSRWTPDSANRRVGRQVVKPVTPQEKVSAIHSLAKDDGVAGRVTGDLLRRPEVVAQVKDEDKVRVVEELTREDQVAAKSAQFSHHDDFISATGNIDTGVLLPRNPRSRCRTT
ncbi:DUF6192 family protein [Streptomyces sp. NPDC096048]|uniref:DUF6192 family protein n=1 Tax=Streptomyces sp. NPDC096048 TaxID=3366072 RepID=UPI003813B62E